jgi:hypothetical protein
MIITHPKITLKSVCNLKSLCLYCMEAKHVWFQYVCNKRKDQDSESVQTYSQQGAPKGFWPDPAARAVTTSCRFDLATLPNMKEAQCFEVGRGRKKR